MPFGHGLYLALKDNPLVQGALIVAAFLAAWWGNNLFVSRRATKRQRARHREASLKKDIAIKENSDEAVKTADSVRANTVRVRSTRMPDERLPNYHYRD